MGHWFTVNNIKQQVLHNPHFKFATNSLSEIKSQSDFKFWFWSLKKWLRMIVGSRILCASLKWWWADKIFNSSSSEFVAKYLTWSDAFLCGNPTLKQNGKHVWFAANLGTLRPRSLWNAVDWKTNPTIKSTNHQIINRESWARFWPCPGVPFLIIS